MAPRYTSEIEKILGKAFTCLDHGFVRLIDIMGSDQSIVQAARVSYGEGTKKVHQDRGLIRYLMRHQHTTPFEMVEFKFHCKMPIFVARQWVRHRTASVNEYSLRYSRAVKEFYMPRDSELKLQAESNRQGRAEETVTPKVQEELLARFQHGAASAWTDYEFFENSGLSRELSRINLPLSLYTEWYWKIDLHNLLHFLKLRVDAHAQYEIRVYALQIAELVKLAVPLAWEAFEDYVLHALCFSGPESRMLAKALQKSNPDWEELLLDSGLSKREKQEFIAKLEKSESRST